MNETRKREAPGKPNNSAGPEGSYDPKWIERFAEQLNVVGTDTAAALMAMIGEDAPDRPLPIEFVLATLPDLEPTKARELISAVRRLGIWNDSEECWLLFQQTCAEASVGAANWIEHAIPLVHRLWEGAPEGSTLRTWAACWLVEHGNSSKRLLLSALCEGTPNRTAKGHYVRRMRLWNKFPQAIEPVLPAAVEALADAWTLLGVERMQDRAAVAALLAIAHLETLPDTARRLRAEVEHVLANSADSTTNQQFSPVLQRLRRDLPQTNYSSSTIEWNDPLSILLLQGRARDAIREAQQLTKPSDDDAYLRRLVLTSEATRRAKSSRNALEILDQGLSLLAKSKEPQTAWAFHCEKAVTHWSRLEYGLALNSTDAARICAGRAGDHLLLYEITILRQRLFYNLRLPDFTSDANSVLDALEFLLREFQLDIPDRQSVLLSRWLSVDVATFHDAIKSARSLLEMVKAAQHTTPQFGRSLHALLNTWDILQAKWSQEPLSLMHFCTNLANLAISARREWPENSSLYTARLARWLNLACRLAIELEAFKEIGSIQSLLERHSVALRDYELPKSFTSREVEDRLALEQVDHLLAAPQNSLQRRWLLKAAYHTYANALVNLEKREMGQHESLRLLTLLQQLKQPSLDNEISPASASSDSAIHYTDIEDVLLDDSDRQAVDWTRLAAYRLAADNAVALDLLLTDTALYCFVIDVHEGMLRCNVQTIGKRWKDKLGLLQSEWVKNGK